MEVNPEAPKINLTKEWLKLFYSRIDNNFSSTRQSLHTTHQWVLTLSIAIITAIISFSASGNPYPNYFGLLILIISFPILLRFFIRSCIEYSIEEKFIILRKEMDFYLLNCGKYSKSDFDKRLLNCVQSYYIDWKCPTKLTKICWDNLLLAYLWVFIVFLGLIFWGMIVVVGDIAIHLIGLSALVMVILEIRLFIKYRGFVYKEWVFPIEVS